MGYSTIHQPCRQDSPENAVATRPQEQGLARSLRTMVRRVLRRRSSRTRFEVRVLAEARRLMESHGCEFSADGAGSGNHRPVAGKPQPE